MALTPRNLPPRIWVNNRQTLPPPQHERIVEVLRIRSRLGPFIFRITKEHAEQMARAAPGRSAVCGACVHDAEVIDELNIAFMSVKLRTVFLRKILDSMESVVLGSGQRGHAGVAGYARTAQKRGLDYLDDGFALRQVEHVVDIEVGVVVPLS